MIQIWRIYIQGKKCQNIKVKSPQKKHSFTANTKTLIQSMLSKIRKIQSIFPWINYKLMKKNNKIMTKVNKKRIFLSLMNKTFQLRLRRLNSTKMIGSLKK